MSAERTLRSSIPSIYTWALCHHSPKWGVDFGEEEENFHAQITQASEDLAPGQPPDLGVQQQLVEVSAHLIAEDGEETGIRGA
ncbi:hypothetical protein NQZ68_020349 [Dissostichus eleginoides]|nr:hypothetical protein NQZ68_020349 [Dissostichus eleginoides]